jgi:hypothetical protein
VAEQQRTPEPELVELVAAVIHRRDCNCGAWDDASREQASDVLAALAAAGRLSPRLRLSEQVAPPDAVAYVEDAQDRLWTGRGLGTWRCVHSDPQGVTGGPQSWAQAWRDHGPLVPLVPAAAPSEEEQ